MQFLFYTLSLFLIILTVLKVYEFRSARKSTRMFLLLKNAIETALNIGFSIVMAHSALCL